MFAACAFSAVISKFSHVLFTLIVATFIAINGCYFCCIEEANNLSCATVNVSSSAHGIGRFFSRETFTHTTTLPRVKRFTAACNDLMNQ
jgi:hypothetical protein